MESPSITASRILAPPVAKPEQRTNPSTAPLEKPLSLVLSAAAKNDYIISYNTQLH